MKARVDAGEFAAPVPARRDARRSRAPGAPRPRPTSSSPTRAASSTAARPDADHGDPSLNAAWLRDALDDVLAGRPVANPRDQAGRLLDQVGVELLFWDGCPSYPAALAELRAALGEDVDVTCARSSREEQAVAEGFPGSPTIRVDGADLFPIDEPPALTCRIYRLRRRPLLPHPEPRAAARGAGAGANRPR